MYFYNLYLATRYRLQVITTKGLDAKGPSKISAEIKQTV